MAVDMALLHTSITDMLVALVMKYSIVHRGLLDDINHSEARFVCERIRDTKILKALSISCNADVFSVLVNLIWIIV